MLPYSSVSYNRLLWLVPFLRHIVQHQALDQVSEVSWGIHWAQLEQVAQSEQVEQSELKYPQHQKS